MNQDCRGHQPLDFLTPDDIKQCLLEVLIDNTNIVITHQGKSLKAYTNTQIEKGIFTHVQARDQSINWKTKKKPLLKRWWFWLLSVFALFLFVGILSSGGESTAYELTKMTTMSKQQIIEKFGKPSEIVREDADGYSFGYDAGFMVSGTEKAH